MIQISPTYDGLLTTGQPDNSRNGLDWHSGCGVQKQSSVTRDGMTALHKLVFTAAT
jgi:hypothetical protein